MTGEVTLGDRPLTIDEVVSVARGKTQIVLSDAALQRVSATRDIIDALAAGDVPAYGVSTGFGALATRHIEPALREKLQQSLVRSHAAGSGDEVEHEVVRALMLLRLQTLMTGRTGIRASTAVAYSELLNHNITPVVYEYGSLGCSGDLAPLAHCALALIGEGVVRDADGVLRETGEVLDTVGLQPVALAAKEGLALINGTDGMLGMLVLALADLHVLVRAADITAAMSIEALMGTDRPFAEDLMALRPHPGQTASAANLRRLLAGSPIVAGHRRDDRRVQDAYSLRCTPQVHGAARDTVAHAAAVADVELRSAIDNPTVLTDGRVESCGHFHGAPVGFACDFLAIAAAEVGAIAERRTDRLLDRTRSHGLPPFLVEDAGVNSGLMLAQYTQAAMVAENRRLAAPASVDSVPTSAMQEDHVSMGWGAARKLRQSVANLGRVIACELVGAARGLEFRRPLAPAPATGAALAALREVGVAGAGDDRWLAPELARAEELVISGALVHAVEATTGPLG